MAMASSCRCTMVHMLVSFGAVIPVPSCSVGQDIISRLSRPQDLVK